MKCYHEIQTNQRKCHAHLVNFTALNPFYLTFQMRKFFVGVLSSLFRNLPDLKFIQKGPKFIFKQKKEQAKKEKIFYQLFIKSYRFPCVQCILRLYFHKCSKIILTMRSYPKQEKTLVLKLIYIHKTADFLLLYFFYE